MGLRTTRILGVLIVTNVITTLPQLFLAHVWRKMNVEFAADLVLKKTKLALELAKLPKTSVVIVVDLQNLELKGAL